MHAVLVAGAVDGDCDPGHTPMRDNVVRDRDVSGPTDIDGAVGLDAIELAGVERTAKEGLADCVTDDLDAVGIGDENSVNVGIVDVIAFDGDVAVLEIVWK